MKLAPPSWAATLGRKGPAPYLLQLSREHILHLVWVAQEADTLHGGTRRAGPENMSRGELPPPYPSVVVWVKEDAPAPLPPVASKRES